jgi:hypothetical protein
MVHVHSLLHDLPVDALWKRAALRDRRDWKIAAKPAVPFWTRRNDSCFTAGYDDTQEAMNRMLFDRMQQ